MKKEVICGIEFDVVDDAERAKRLRTNVALAASKAFCQVRKAGRFTKDQLDILTNEVLRGRLNPSDIEEVNQVAMTITMLCDAGITLKEIAILRSLCFDYEEIKSFADKHKKVEAVLKELNLTDPDIETIYGLTARTLTDWYVPYSIARGV